MNRKFSFIFLSCVMVSVECHFVTFYFTFSFGFFVYGSLKWIQFSRHFLITKRFPMITNTIIITCIIAELSVISMRWIGYSRNYSQSMMSHIEDGIIVGIIFSIPQICAFIITVLLCYRLLLIYFRYKTTQKNIKTLHLTNELSISLQSSINTIEVELPRLESNEHCNIKEINNDIPAETLTQRESDCHGNIPMTEKHIKSAVTLTVYVIFCGILITISHLNLQYLYFPQLVWTSVIIFGIIMIILIRCKKVKEGIGCIQEAYLTLLYVLFSLIMNSMYGAMGNLSLLLYINTIALPLQGLLPLYFSLYVVYKCEGCLDVHNWEQKHETELYIEYSSTAQNHTIINTNNNNNNI
eukprot:236330_1